MRFAPAVCLTAVLIGSAGACGGDTEVETEGRLTFGFEVSSFLPCNREEAWWVIATEETVAQYGALNLPEGQPAFARLRGNRSDRGHYGHLSSYRYEFEVAEVVILRSAQPSDCEG